MSKRRMVQSNLIKNSIAAYFAAIEIHNKPNIAYRYETVTLLLINAWELALKAYVRKYLKKTSIYTSDGHTKSLDKCLGYVTEDINSAQKGSFEAVKENIILMEEYRNNVTHFYSDQLEPYIFMISARAALNYVDFIKKYFKKDIMADDGLFILPLGFKLPFKPEDFLSDNVAKYAASDDAKSFISKIVKSIHDLDEAGIEDSVVLGFDVYFQSIKKAKNSDILAAITSKEEADVLFAKETKVTIDNNASHTMNLSDSEFRRVWKYTHSDVVEWCKNNIPGFKMNHIFNKAKKALGSNNNFVYTRRLDNRNSKSASQNFYSEMALDKIQHFYLTFEDDISDD